MHRAILAYRCQEWKATLLKIVAAAQDAANRAIEEAQIIRLSVEGQRQLAALLLNPPRPGRALKKAFKRRRELLGAE